MFSVLRIYMVTKSLFNVIIMVNIENRQIRLLNLRKLLKEAKTAAALASAANTSPAYISQILSDKTKGSIGNQLARRLELAAGKPVGWLDTLHAEDDPRRHLLSVKHIPLVEFSRIVEWHLGERWMPKKIVSVIAEEDQLNDGKIFCIEMVGDAMMSAVDIASSICPGDIAIVDQEVEPSFGDVVLVKIKNSVKVRQLLKDGDESILKAFNQQYPIIPFTNQTKILGVVVEIRRMMHKKQLA